MTKPWIVNKKISVSKYISFNELKPKIKRTSNLYLFRPSNLYLFRPSCLYLFRPSNLYLFRPSRTSTFSHPQEPQTSTLKLTIRFLLMSWNLKLNPFWASWILNHYLKSLKPLPLQTLNNLKLTIRYTYEWWLHETNLI